MREKHGNSQGSCEHITIGRGKGSGERLAGKPRAQDRKGELQGYSGAGCINSNSQGSCEHITIGRGKGSGERLAGKPRAQDRRDRRNLWEKLHEM